MDNKDQQLNVYRRTETLNENGQPIYSRELSIIDGYAHKIEKKYIYDSDKLIDIIRVIDEPCADPDYLKTYPVTSEIVTKNNL